MPGEPTAGGASPPRWRARWIGWLLAGWFSSTGFCAPEAAAAAAGATTNLAELRLRIRERIEQPRFRSARWGIQALTLAKGTVLFETNALQPFIPASNTKLFTGALALDQLGTEYRITTSFFARSRPDSRGRLKGDLLVYGRGDPSLHPDRPGFPPEQSSSLFEWVKALTNAGIRAIEGDLIADESYFIGASTGSGWSVDDLPFYYSPEVSALSFNQNVVDCEVRPGSQAGLPASVSFVPFGSLFEWTNRLVTGPTNAGSTLRLERELGSHRLHFWGSVPLGIKPLVNTVTVHQPALWLGTALGRALTEAGVRWKGRVRVVTWRDRLTDPFPVAPWIEVARVRSPRLANLVDAMMKPSDNLHAQLLLLQVGAQEPVVAHRTTEEAGFEAMRRFLRPIVASVPEPFFEEGSGLSGRNRVPPATVVALLSSMTRHPAADAFRASLPVAGRDGSLRHRLRGTAAEGNLAAKTGTLRGVATLSGYVTTAGGELLSFSILLNDYFPKAGEPPARDEVDAVAALLAAFQGTAN